MAYFVNVYEVDLRRGGAEEGAWYYQVGTPVKSIACRNQRRAKQIEGRVDRLVILWNKGTYPPESVLSRGDWRQVVIETRPAQAYPLERPTYS